MALVCSNCGMYIQPQVMVDEQSIRCPICGHVEAMRILPLFVVTGASGVGKTTIAAHLRRCLPQWAIFETDIIHGADWQQVKCNWLRIAHALAQSGQPTLLCGTLLPDEVNACDHRPMFSQIYFLNLHCSDAVRQARLQARPAWRGCDAAFIARHRHFAQWLLEHAATAFDPPMPTVDTTDADPSAIAAQISAWALGHRDVRRDG